MSRLAGLIQACVLAVSMCLPAPVGAQERFPNRPVRVISDASPSSAIDVGLRVIAEGMSQHWGQQAVVVNQPGGGGAISARATAQSAPDGHTLYCPGGSVFLILPGKAADLPLVIPRDFAPVGFAFDQYLTITVSAQLGVRTLPEFIALAKQKPGELSYAVTGVGRLTHMLGELLQIRTGIKLQMVPYSNNSAQAMADVIAGRVSMIVTGYLGPSSTTASGLVPIAIGAPERVQTAPELPTIAETIPGLIASGWQVMLAPNGTPAPIIKAANEGLNAALALPLVKDRLVQRGAPPRPMSPEQVTTFIEDQQVLWKPVLDRLADQMK